MKPGAVMQGDKNAERKCTDCGQTHRAYSHAGRPGHGALGCVIDPCDECGGRHVGPLPTLHPCPSCGSGIRYAAHHRCLGTWGQPTKANAA